MHKNEKYYIALDLDGTLIKDGNQIDEKTVKYLKELNKQHKIILATGRPYRSSKYYYDMLELDTPIINYNGSYVHHPTNANFLTKSLFICKDALTNFILDLQDDFLNAFCEIEDDIYLWEENDYIKPYLHYKGGHLATGHFNDILPANPHGAILITKPDTTDKLIELVNTKYNQYFKVRIWYSHSEVISELYNLNTSKAYGLQEVCKFYDISSDNLIAIGDGHNDIEMIKFAKLGVAMANSHPDLLKVSDIIIPSIDENGVLKFLQHYFKNKN